MEKINSQKELKIKIKKNAFHPFLLPMPFWKHTWTLILVTWQADCNVPLQPLPARAGLGLGLALTDAVQPR